MTASSDTNEDPKRLKVREINRRRRSLGRISMMNLDGAAVSPLPNGGTTNPSPIESSSGGSSSSRSDKLDRKLLKSSPIETPLSVIKVPPLSMFINGGNNKVGTSYLQHDDNITFQRNLQLAAQLQATASNNQLPVGNRKVRDSGAFLFMIAFLSLLGYIIWDGLVVKEADINLVVHGHDSFGNICGRSNKPINLVDRSGKNFTSKPFTKYTLINSQFERYTLDMGRTNNELYYIKQTNYSEPIDSLVAEMAAATKLRARSSHSDGTSLNGNQLRARRSTTSSSLGQNYGSQDEFWLERVRQNGSAMRSLKSASMYHYPPSYGYVPSTRAKQTVIGQVSAANSAVTVLPNQRLHVDDEGIHKDPEERLFANKASEEREKGKESESRNNNSTSASSWQVNVNSDPLSALDTAQHGTSESPPYLLDGPSSTTSAIMTTVTTTTMATNQSPVVYFDDHTGDSDHYEHMLITPRVGGKGVSPTMPGQGPLDGARGRHPADILPFEASSQLLYLTECVDHCPSDHLELIFYRCMPKNWRFSLFPNAINVTRTFIDDILTDMSHCYRELIYTFSLALVLSLALLILLRFLASIIIWSCLIILIALLVLMTIYSWLSYYNQIVDLNNLLPHDASYTDRLASSDKWLIGSIFLTFVTFIMVAAVIFMRKRILLVTKLFRESGKAIADMPLLLLQPLFTFAVLLLLTSLWAIGLICLQSMKIPVVDMSTGFVVFKAEAIYKLMKWYHIFAFLWISHFAIACQHYVIGASVSKWYFSSQRYNLNSPIGTSVAELILYYLGSVALGSFLVAIFKVVRILIRQIQFLVQRNCMGSNPTGSSGTQSSVATEMGQQQMSSSWCGSCTYVWRLFIWFFDNIVMIINRDAYVEIAIHGHGFLAGAKQALIVLASNPLKLLAVKSVSNVLLVVAKVCVVVGTVSMSMVLLEEKTNQLNYSWSPIVVTAIYAYVVAHWFLSVYEMVIDALFICYCEDYERTKSLQSSESSSNNHINGSNFMTQILRDSNQIY